MTAAIHFLFKLRLALRLVETLEGEPEAVEAIACMYVTARLFQMQQQIPTLETLRALEVEEVREILLLLPETFLVVQEAAEAVEEEVALAILGSLEDRGLHQILRLTIVSPLLAAPLTL